jgi:2-polyprenyl-6-methoxyphenol hydroxylase-like FAD-dependent oxidoreductase
MAEQIKTHFRHSTKTSFDGGIGSILKGTRFEDLSINGTMKSATTDGGLKIGISGAGVAGLSAAIGLRRAGHTVTIFERSQFRNEAGAAVSIPPNGARLLDSWGFDEKKAGGIENIQVRRPRGDTLENMGPTLRFDHVEKTYGSKWNFYHRVDMHQELKDLAVDPNGPGKPAVIKLGSQVVDVDCEEGIITIKDGSKHQFDLVIIADGQHVSRITHDFDESTSKHHRTGSSKKSQVSICQC